MAFAVVCVHHSSSTSGFVVTSSLLNLSDLRVTVAVHLKASGKHAI